LLTIFIFKQDKMKYSYPTLFKHFHGRREIRITVNDFGEVQRKPYEYPGIPHVDIVPSVIAVEAKDVPKIEALFHKFGVSYIKIPLQKATLYVDEKKRDVQSLKKFQNWSEGGVWNGRML